MSEEFQAHNPISKISCPKCNNKNFAGYDNTKHNKIYFVCANCNTLIKEIKKE